MPWCWPMEPEGVVKLLNHYLEAMTRIIARYGGTIDEFIGDAILVVFGAPLPLAQTEARAVACAIEMLNAMPAINVWNAEQKLPPVEMGIGVHSGEVVLGNIGSELRAKYGIVGSTINLTSRVESFTVGGQVLISEATRARCGELLQLGAAQVVSPKGVKGTLTIHEALGVIAPFNVSLQSAAEELVKPNAPIELRFGLVKNKQVAELSHVAHVEALSALGLELKVDEELPTLSDLQMRVVDGGGLRGGDLYGKVLRSNVRPNVVYLRLTSVPPELKPFLEAARSGAARPATHRGFSGRLAGGPTDRADHTHVGGSRECRDQRHRACARTARTHSEPGRDHRGQPRRIRAHGEDPSLHTARACAHHGCISSRTAP